jgi:hypothetical protein
VSVSRSERAAERLVKEMRGFFLDLAPYLARWSAVFIPFVPLCPGVHKTLNLRVGLAVNRSKRLVQKRMEVAWEGWGEASKIFSMADVASEKIQIEEMKGWERTKCLMMDEAWPRAYISAL